MEHYNSGEIILYKNDSWAQYVENTLDGIKLYDGLRYVFCDDDEIEKATLPF